jgi:UDP-glucose 4-epimerase
MLEHLQKLASKPSRVVVLGSKGFLARALVQQLADNGIDSLAVGSSEIDLILPDSVAKMGQLLRPDDCLVITSALTPDKGRDVATLMKNLEMARHLASLLESRGCSQVIYISSDSVYSAEDSLIRESSTRQASDLYSLMHIAREQILIQATAKSQTPLCIVCPCAIYGAADTHNSYGPNRFFRTALKDGKIMLFGNGEEIRDHILVEDVARLIGLCIAHRSIGILNAATGAAQSFHQVADSIAGIVGAEVIIECLPRSGAITHRHFDPTLRIKAFPEFTPTPLIVGLTKMHRDLTSISIK